MSAVAETAPISVEARNALVVSNQGLAHRVARKFLGRGLDLEDLVQAGCVGLIRAAEKFEPERGLRFSTYAVTWISQAIHKALATVRPVHCDPHSVRRGRDVLARVDAVEAETGVRPTLAEAIVAMHPEGRWAQSRRERSLSAAMAVSAGRESMTDVEVLAPGRDPLSDMIDAESCEQLRLALAMLPDDQRALLNERFELDGTPRRPVRGTAALHARRREAEALEALRRLLDGPGPYFTASG